MSARYDMYDRLYIYIFMNEFTFSFYFHLINIKLILSYIEFHFYPTQEFLKFIFFEENKKTQENKEWEQQQFFKKQD